MRRSSGALSCRRAHMGRPRLCTGVSVLHVVGGPCGFAHWHCAEFIRQSCHNNRVGAGEQVDTLNLSACVCEVGGRLTEDFLSPVLVTEATLRAVAHTTSFRALSASQTAVMLTGAERPGSSEQTSCASPTAVSILQFVIATGHELGSPAAAAVKHEPHRGRAAQRPQAASCLRGTLWSHRRPC